MRIYILYVSTSQSKGNGQLGDVLQFCRYDRLKKKKKKAARKKAGGDVKNGGFLVASCSDAILDKVEGTSLPASQLHGSLGKHEP